MDCFACARNDEGCLKIESNNKHACRPGLEPGPIITGPDVARGWGGSPLKNEERRLARILIAKPVAILAE
jgi:hypothetical protein